MGDHVESPPRSSHQQSHQWGRAIYLELEEKSVKDAYQCFSPTSHLVWGRVVPDIPDFCRELMDALAEGLHRTGA
jgi:hypothetical protein